MYLYFNQEGELTTNIPHGKILRQGSSLDIVVCLDLDFFYNQGEQVEDWKVNVKLGLPNKRIGTVMIVADPVIEAFHKTNDSEVTYDLIEGNEYYMYKFHFSPEQSTFLAGQLEIYTSLVKYVAVLNQQGVSTGQYSESQVVYQGAAIVFIERVLGYGIEESIDKSNLHYSNLVAQINEIDTRKANRKTFILYQYENNPNITLDNNKEYAYTASSINSVILSLPSVVDFGYESAVYIKNGNNNTPVTLYFEGVTLIKNGQKINEYTEIPANYNVSFKVKHIGVGIYCYIEEIER